MLYAIVAASGLLAVFLALALAREFRLRRALQSLLARIFRHWRTTHANTPKARSPDDDPAPVDPAHRDRM